MRRFVVIGRTAVASAHFSLDDLPSTSGRLDVLLRCVRAALLVSHGVRRDTVIYLVLLGGADAAKTLRFDGAASQYVRPDERSLAVTVKKALDQTLPEQGFAEVRAGIFAACGGLEVVLADLPKGAAFQLEAGARDIRDVDLSQSERVFFVGDHLGFDEPTRQSLTAFGATPLSLGPIDVHAEDAITLVCGELDRRMSDEDIATRPLTRESYDPNGRAK